MVIALTAHLALQCLIFPEYLTLIFDTCIQQRQNKQQQKNKTKQQQQQQQQKPIQNHEKQSRKLNVWMKS